MIHGFFNKKRLGITMLALALGTTGCVMEQEVVPSPGNGRPIVFTSVVEKSTRAAAGHPIGENVTEIPDARSFAVYGYQSALGDGSDIAPYPDLSNQKVTRDGTKFTYAPAANWPMAAEAKLSFFGYYPWTDQSVGSPNPAVSMDASDQEMSITYTVPANPAGHIDLMYTRTALTPGADPVNLAFGHALTWLRFQARMEDYTGDVKITKITVRDAVTKGTLTVLDPVTQTGKPEWTLATDKTDYEVTTANGLLDVPLTGSLQPVTGADGQMLVLPQSVDGIVVEVEAAQDGAPFPETFVFPLATSPDWTMNNIVTYEITLGSSGMFLTTKVNNWNENTINVIQDGQWWLSVTEDYFEFDAAGGDGSLIATTNYSRTDLGFPAGLQRTVEYSDPLDADWLTFTDITGTDGDLSWEFRIEAAANNISDRAAKINITAGNLTKVVNVTQPSLYNIISASIDRSSLTAYLAEGVTFSITGTYPANTIQVRIWNATDGTEFVAPEYIATEQNASTGTHTLYTTANDSWDSRDLIFQYCHPGTGQWNDISTITQTGYVWGVSASGAAHPGGFIVTATSTTYMPAITLRAVVNSAQIGNSGTLPAGSASRSGTVTVPANTTGASRTVIIQGYNPNTAAWVQLASYTQNAAIVLSTGRIMATASLSTTGITWAEVMGISTTYNTAVFGGVRSDGSYTQTQATGCAAYTEPGYDGPWYMPNSVEVIQIVATYRIYYPSTATYNGSNYYGHPCSSEYSASHMYNYGRWPNAGSAYANGWAHAIATGTTYRSKSNIGWSMNVRCVRPAY